MNFFTSGKFLFLVFFMFQFSAASVSDADIEYAKKALKDGFYEVADRKLEQVKYDHRLSDRYSQEAVYLLAFSAFMRKDYRAADQVLDRLMLLKDLHVEKYDIMLLKLNILIARKDFYLSEKTLCLIWNMDIERDKKYSALDILSKGYADSREYGLQESFLNEMLTLCRDDTDTSRIRLCLLESMLVQGRLERAGSILKDLSLGNSPDPVIREKFDLLTGRFFLGGRDYDNGMRQYLQLYQQDEISGGGRQEALFGLCLSYWNMKNYDLAESSLEEYIRRYPYASNLNSANLMLAQVLLRQNKYVQAEKMLEELTETEIHSQVFYRSMYWLGEAYYRQKKYDRALEVYDRLTELKEYDEVNEIFGVYGKGWIFYEQNLLEQAYEKFMQAGRSDINHKFVREAFIMAGNCLYLSAKYDQAGEVYEAYLTRYAVSDRNDEVLYKLGLTRAKLSRAEDALKAWETLHSEYPGSQYAPEAVWRSAKLLYENGRFEDAAKKFSLIADQYPDSEYSDFSRLETGNSLYNQCKYPEAAEAYRAAMEKSRDPGISQRAEYYTGWCYYLLNRENEALKVFNEFLIKYPASELAPQVLFWLGEYDYNKKIFGEALQKFNQLIEAYSKSELVDNSYFLAGKSAFQMGQFDKTISMLSCLIMGFRDSALLPDAYYLRGESYFNAGRFEEAVDDFIVFETAYENSYLRKSAFERLGDVFFEMREYRNAAIYFEKAGIMNRSENGRDDPMLLFRQAECSERMGNPEKALSMALTLVYEDIPARIYNRAVDFCVELYIKKNDYSAAISLLTKLAQEGASDRDEIRQRIRKLKYLESHRKEQP